jgi:ABC-type multidrug transport system, ATPase component
MRSVLGTADCLLSCPPFLYDFGTISCYSSLYQTSKRLYCRAIDSIEEVVCFILLQGSRGALLTTHSMEEADALCSRVGIMVQGQLRY